MNSSYDVVASEYYDPSLHPTCANFDQLSRRFLGPRIRKLMRDGYNVVEMGAGRSMIAPLAGAYKDVTVVLVDNSEKMLAHSRSMLAPNIDIRVADAASTGIESNSVDLLVSSLGDPYNTQAFWKEVSRLLKADGKCLFTCPTAEWATKFRSPIHYSEAEFLIGGTQCYLPSYVFYPDAQEDIFHREGLFVIESEDYFASDLQGHISPKLLAVDGPVARGYVLAKIH